jgi:hypothetical protein
VVLGAADRSADADAVGTEAELALLAGESPQPASTPTSAAAKVTAAAPDRAERLRCVNIPTTLIAGSDRDGQFAERVIIETESSVS